MLNIVYQHEADRYRTHMKKYLEVEHDKELKSQYLKDNEDFNKDTKPNIDNLKYIEM